MNGAAKKYDFLIVGAGFFGAICAHELTNRGFSCLVIDRRKHIGGNCFTEERDGIHLHAYGPHIFHTSNERVWSWINKFANFNNFRLHPVANYKGEIYSLPFNMWTFNKLWGVTSPNEAKKIIKEQSKHIIEPQNLEEQAIKSVGSDIYEKLIKGYTSKQWMKHPRQLPKEIIKRLPVRFSYDSNYFNDTYQGIPIGGYTQIFRQLLNSIDVQLGVDYLKNRSALNSIAKRIIYTGPIDEYFDYSEGELEYKTTRFEHKLFNLENYQGTAMMNYTDIETPYTRTIEHKHFDPVEIDKTWVTWEYPSKYKAGVTEAFYPVNDDDNNKKYCAYRELANLEENVFFGGRLAEYKYYDMHNVIERALIFSHDIIDRK